MTSAPPLAEPMPAHLQCQHASYCVWPTMGLVHPRLPSESTVLTSLPVMQGAVPGLARASKKPVAKKNEWHRLEAVSLLRLEEDRPDGGERLLAEEWAMPRRLHSLFISTRPLKQSREERREKVRRRAFKVQSLRAEPSCEAFVRSFRAKLSCEAFVRSLRAKPSCEAFVV